MLRVVGPCCGIVLLFEEHGFLHLEALQKKKAASQRKRPVTPYNKAY
jgi:hypothetical protein